MDHARQIFQYTLNCATSFCRDKSWRSRSFVLCRPSREDSLTDFRLIRIWPRGSGRPEVDREKLSSHLRLSTDESLQAPPFQLGGSSIESRAFLLFICRCRAHSRIWRTKRRRRGLAKLYRARETAYLASSAPGNSLRSQIKCHSPRRRVNCEMRRRICPLRWSSANRTHVNCTAKSVRSFVEYLLTLGETITWR